jgi:hypothetical protein
VCLTPVLVCIGNVFSPCNVCLPSHVLLSETDNNAEGIEKVVNKGCGE